MSDDGRFGTFGENPELPWDRSFKYWEESIGTGKKPSDYSPKPKPYTKPVGRDIGPTPKGKGYTWQTKESLSGLSKTDIFAMNLAEVIDELEDIINYKQQDYGSNAILGSPYGALNGIIVRMHDKMNRIIHLEKTKATSSKINNESLRDTFIDVAGYALLAVLVIDDRFPKE